MSNNITLSDMTPREFAERFRKAFPKVSDIFTDQEIEQRFISDIQNRMKPHQPSEKDGDQLSQVFDAESAILAIPNIATAHFTGTDSNGRLIFDCLTSNGTTETWAVKEKARIGDQPMQAASSI